MPHKRAKRAIREQERSKKGSDLAPTRPGAGGDALSSEPLPKAFLRTINAAQVRADFRAKRKLRGEDGEDGEDGQKKGKRQKIDGGRDTHIRPGETLAHFNKRIETDMRPLVRSAMQSSLVTVRAQHKKGSAPSESTPSSKSAPTTNSKSNNAHSKSNPKSSSAADADPKPAPPPIDKHASRPKEFARTSSAAPRRLNDIAQAPPELSSFARKKSSTNTPAGKAGGKSTKASVLSPAQQLAMAAAREDAVQRYRALKASRRAAGGGDGGERGGGAVGEEEGDE
ncbi:hypothetical protein B0H14DRAFT_3867315 [Mycena olivaceomarginata]|nr:hypothetical protein B0H14DRAFT_3867315 [Mycena olivaceomarginata]